MPICTLSNTAGRPHVELFVGLKSECNCVRDWHLVIHRGMCLHQDVSYFKLIPMRMEQFIFPAAINVADTHSHNQSLDARPREA